MNKKILGLGLIITVIACSHFLNTGNQFNLKNNTHVELTGTLS